jgi:hypothetical protein
MVCIQVVLDGGLEIWGCPGWGLVMRMLTGWYWLPKLDPAIAGGVALRTAPTSTRACVESLLLAGLDDPSIAARVGIDADIVAGDHDFFLDVWPILGHSDPIPAREFGVRFPAVILAGVRTGRPPSIDGGRAAREVL